MTSLLNFILYSYLLIYFSGADRTQVTRKNVFLHRKKRYLAFPPGSNLAVSFAAVKALLRVQPTGWNILYEVDYPFALPSDPRWLKMRGRRDVEKRDLYTTIGAGLSKAGFNGTFCIKRMICDAQKYIPYKGKSLIRDILVTVFSSPEDAFNIDDDCNSDLFSKCSVSIMDYIMVGLSIEDGQSDETV